MVMKTMSVTLEGPANALALNRDSNQVVVAGRNVFKVFSIDEDDFVERINLRVAKNLNLNFSCADVVWNLVEDHILATAATNGSVVTWNLNKSSRTKQEMVFHDHKRTVNKVCFHTTEPHILLSGSQDGTMKCFDLRKKEATSTFYSQSESVRDVQFSPHQYFTFAAVQENGNVQLWDLRRTDRYERQFTAHNGPVFACDWHPEERKWLATAGRDKTIKIWNITSKPEPDYCILTIASVARVKWRPQRKYCIASSSLVVDFSVNIWDIRRPYVPFATFNEHKDVTTGFAWKNEPHTLLSTSKDCTIYQHVFKDAVRPADSVNSVAMDINVFGDVSYAASDKIIGESSANIKGVGYPPTRLPVFFRKVPNLTEQFRSAYSSLLVFSNHDDKNISMDWFVYCAKNYLLCGRPLGELCDHNANVATEIKKTHIAQVWKLLKMLYTTGPNLTSEFSWGGLSGVSDALRNVDVEKGLDSSQDANNQKTSRHNSGNTLLNAGSKSGSRHVSGGGGSHGTADRPIADTSGATDDSDTTETDHDSTLTNIANGMAQGDYFFGEGDMDHLVGFDYGEIATLSSVQDWTLPNEAFQPRHPIKDCFPPPEIANDPSTVTSACEDETEVDTTASDVEDQTRRLATSTVPPLPSWCFTELILDLLHHHSSQGDVQTSVSVMLVLGDRLKGSVDETSQEQWFNSYIELLSRFQLWNVANQVIRLSSLPAINSLNQQSTTVHSLCGHCRKPMVRIGWYCDNCKFILTSCSVCHQVVRGFYVWCQGCAHGGHPQHIQEWFQVHPWCPAGCGHLCEYT